MDLSQAVSVEKISEQVHKAYCRHYKKRKGEEYWTKGDYNKLSEDVKEYDRTTVRAVLEAIDYRTLLDGVGRKHDCHRWADEGMGCSICSKRLPTMSKQDIIDIQEHTNGIITSLKDEVKRLRGEVENIRKSLSQMEDKCSK